VLRIVDLVSVVAGRFAALVHESARRESHERSRHERFIRTRMIAGVVALGCVPLYLPLCLAGRGATSAPDYLALLFLAMPISSAVVLSRTGMLATAYGISSAGFAGLAGIAAASGGIASPALVWLLAAPLEALVSGSRKGAIASGAMALIGALPVALQMAGGFRFAEAGAAEAVQPLLLITAVAHALAQAAAHMSVEAAAPEQPHAPEVEELSFLQAHGDLITWHDRNGQVLRTGGAAARLCGSPANALLGRGLFWRVHVADRPAFLKALSDAAASERPVVVQFRLHRRDGTPADAQFHPRLGTVSSNHKDDVIWTEMRARRVEQDGEIGVVAVSRDISAYRRGAEEVEVAQKEAERASAAKGQFLATVGHELRTPLNAVIGFSEALANGSGPALDERRRGDYLRIIREAGGHLLQVVDTLQDTARIEAGHFDFVPAPFDAGALAHGCCDLMSLEAKRAGLLLARDIAPDLPELVADRRACKQMLLNLMSNAIKFTPRGGCVTVALHRDRDRIMFSVSDTGIGIAREALPKLGNAFFRAGSGQSPRHHGTGLGLTVVRGLVGLHRGTLTIESAPGDGTSVIVSLPIDCGRGTTQTAAPVRIRAIARPRPQLQAARVG
jgi:cell cycle sensor histidine kinase DivJ